MSPALSVEESAERDADGGPERDAHCDLVGRRADGGADRDAERDPDTHLHVVLPDIASRGLGPVIGLTADCVASPARNGRRWPPIA